MSDTPRGVTPGRWYFFYESESEADARECRSSALAFGNLQVSAAVGPLLRADGDPETSASVPNDERCFHAACEALKRLNSVRHMWNGPIHIAAAHLLKATGPNPCAPEPSACPYCTSDNEAIRSTFYDLTCEVCVKRMGRP